MGSGVPIDTEIARTLHPSNSRPTSRQRQRKQMKGSAAKDAKEDFDSAEFDYDVAR
jgi:hypothetical protein